MTKQERSKLVRRINKVKNHIEREQLRLASIQNQLKGCESTLYFISESIRIMDIVEKRKEVTKHESSAL